MKKHQNKSQKNTKQKIQNKCSNGNHSLVQFWQKNGSVHLKGWPKRNVFVAKHWSFTVMDRRTFNKKTIQLLLYGLSKKLMQNHCLSTRHIHGQYFQFAFSKHFVGFKYVNIFFQAEKYCNLHRLSPCFLYSYQSSS